MSENSHKRIGITSLPFIIMGFATHVKKKPLLFNSSLNWICINDDTSQKVDAVRT